MGQPAILINITKQADANVIETVDRIYAMLPGSNAGVPAGIQFSVLTDLHPVIRASVHDMQLHARATIVLVMLGGVRLPAPVGADRASGSPCRLVAVGTCAACGLRVSRSTTCR